MLKTELGVTKNTFILQTLILLATVSFSEIEKNLQISSLRSKVAPISFGHCFRGWILAAFA